MDISLSAHVCRAAEQNKQLLTPPHTETSTRVTTHIWARMKTSRTMGSLAASALLALCLLLQSVQAIKFEIPAHYDPQEKCIWNYALTDTLVVITLNVIGIHQSEQQSVDIQIVDGSKHNNVYLSKKKVQGETRMAINSHSNADLGICFKNTLSKSKSASGRADGDFEESY